MLKFFFLKNYFNNFFKKNLLIDFFYKNYCFYFVFYYLNITVIFFGEKFLIEYQTKNIFFYFKKYVYCGDAIHPTTGGDYNGKNSNTVNYLVVSDKYHILSLLPQINADGSFTDEYYIKTHAFNGTGVAAYNNGLRNSGLDKFKIYHKDPEGSQNTQETWKFEKQCDDKSHDICLTWKINAINSKTPGYYMRAAETDDHLYLQEFDEKNDDIEDFLWTIEFQ